LGAGRCQNSFARSNLGHGQQLTSSKREMLEGSFSKQPQLTVHTSEPRQTIFLSATFLAACQDDLLLVARSMYSSTQMRLCRLMHPVCRCSVVQASQRHGRTSCGQVHLQDSSWVLVIRTRELLVREDPPFSTGLFIS
jgi:hypothetical protein